MVRKEFKSVQFEKESIHFLYFPMPCHFFKSLYFRQRVISHWILTENDPKKSMTNL